MPSPKAYGENAAEEGKRAFEAHLGKAFELGLPGQALRPAGEKSPYGLRGCAIPVCDPDALIAAGLDAMKGWQALGDDGQHRALPGDPRAPQQAELRDRPRGDDDNRPGAG